MIIHLADAPCHGRKYHNHHDDYPNGDPSGVSPEDLLKQIARKRIHFYFIEINSSTTRMMTDIFKNCYEQSEYTFAVEPLGGDTGKLVPTVVESIKESIKATMHGGMAHPI